MADRKGTARRFQDITAGYLEDLERRYVERKARECEELHNRLAEVIGEMAPSVQNLLFVLEMLKFEALEEKFRLLFQETPRPEGLRVE